jgi:formylglycine-generating enzyme required for sulfatase activity
VPSCFVPGGRFLRGSTLSPDEQPVHEVELSPFAMDEFPVTNALYAGFIEDGGYHQAPLWTPAGWAWRQAGDITRPNYWDDPVWSAPEMPVTGVSWWEALAFARWAGKTLPTEAQWEYACRGPAGHTYPWGEDEPDLEMANFAPDCDPLELDRRPTPPDRYPRNVSDFGVRDLVGNFSEWCLDNYAVRYQEAGEDPVHVAREEDNHVVRGGCGLHDTDYLRGSARDHYHPGLRDNLVGFRCVRPATEGDQ